MELEVEKEEVAMVGWVGVSIFPLKCLKGLDTTDDGIDNGIRCGCGRRTEKKV